MKAAEARKLTKNWHTEAQRENREYNRKRIAREKQTAEAVWEKRSEALVTKIDGWITSAATEGKQGTYAPSTLNPNGDEVIWLEDKRDWPIYDLLMKHYRDEGYEVEEYQNHGMKITW